MKAFWYKKCILNFFGWFVNLKLYQIIEEINWEKGGSGTSIRS